MPSLFMAPMVSAAIGMNEYDCVNEAYLVFGIIIIIINYSGEREYHCSICYDIYNCALLLYQYEH